VDSKNIQWERDFKSIEQRLLSAEKRENDKQIEIQNLTASLSDQKGVNEALSLRVNKLEQTNRLLTQALTASEQTRIELQSQSEEYKQTYQQMEQKFSHLKIEFNNKEKHYEISEKELELLKEKYNHQLEKNQELNDDNEELRESVKYLQEQLQEKTLQEQQHNREKQLNSNFKDFIQVKRTLQACQQENEQLKIELKKLQIKLLNKKE
jgi:chromosome segregation ATPase